MDESFHVIERGEVYRHIKNLKVSNCRLYGGFLLNVYEINYDLIKVNEINDLMTINGKVDSFLTACLVLTFALVVGLGLGHFLGERAAFSIQISRNG